MSNDVSEEHVTSIFWVEQTKHGTSVKQACYMFLRNIG
jgi:hypothetical protein